jgi:hypothetical protein
MGSSTFVNNIISNNTAGGGGGYDGGKCSPTMMNNIFYGNTTAIKGGAIWLGAYSSARITNTIFWNNEAPIGSNIWLGKTEKPSTITIDYSDVQGGQSSVYVDPGCTLNWGPGMIDSDPLFVEPTNGDFHLTFTSPCKDTGDNTTVTESTDFEGDPRIVYGTVDMGADEFYTHLYYTGDATPSGAVKLKFTDVPGTSPVGFWVGSVILETPLQTNYGDWWNQWWIDFSYPTTGPIVIAPIPSNGIEVLPGTLPSTPTGPYTIYFQGMIGNSLTNLCVMEVE